MVLGNWSLAETWDVAQVLKVVDGGRKGTRADIIDVVISPKGLERVCKRTCGGIFEMGPNLNASFERRQGTPSETTGGWKNPSVPEKGLNRALIKDTDIAIFGMDGALERTVSQTITVGISPEA